LPLVTTFSHENLISTKRILNKKILYSEVHSLGATTELNLVEPSGVQALKNPNPLKDVEAFAVLGVAVLV